VKVFRKINEIEKNDNLVVMAMGTFDGLHLGHNAVLDSVLKFCKEENGESYIFTFSNSPKAVFQPYMKHLQLISWGINYGF